MLNDRIIKTYFSPNNNKYKGFFGHMGIFGEQSNMFLNSHFWEAKGEIEDCKSIRADLSNACSPSKILIQKCYHFKTFFFSRQ